MLKDTERMMHDRGKKVRRCSKSYLLVLVLSRMIYHATYAYGPCNYAVYLNTFEEKLVPTRTRPP